MVCGIFVWALSKILQRPRVNDLADSNRDIKHVVFGILLWSVRVACTIHAWQVKTLRFKSVHKAQTSQTFCGTKKILLLNWNVSSSIGMWNFKTACNKGFPLLVHLYTFDVKIFCVGVINNKTLYWSNIYHTTCLFTMFLMRSKMTAGG